MGTEIFDKINEVPYKFKKHGRLELLLQKAMCPDVMQVQYFTHCQFMDFDEVRLELHSKKSKLKTKLRRYAILRKLNNFRKRSMQGDSHEVMAMVRAHVDKLRALPVYQKSGLKFHKELSAGIVHYCKCYADFRMFEELDKADSINQ